jgi:hypothetical protein
LLLLMLLLVLLEGVCVVIFLPANKASFKPLPPFFYFFFALFLSFFFSRKDKRRWSSRKVLKLASKKKTKISVAMMQVVASPLLQRYSVACWSMLEQHRSVVSCSITIAVLQRNHCCSTAIVMPQRNHCRNAGLRAIVSPSLLCWDVHSTSDFRCPTSVGFRAMSNNVFCHPLIVVHKLMFDDCQTFALRSTVLRLSSYVRWLSIPLLPVLQGDYAWKHKCY